MATEKGTISINTENIFPIIKKFLYSDNEIFLRELVSNAVDATQKIKKLSSLGQYDGELGDLKISIAVDKEKKTITISDKGLGMTAEEIKKYINQIAFSGAKEFLDKYNTETDKSQIIGQFGLGFYSAYMVAKEVEIITKSYQNEPAARWICDGSTSFEISDSDRTERGTDIILHVSDDAEEFLEESKLEQILTKYGKFLPIEIQFGEKVINNSSPIWIKSPADLKDEDYLAFYKEL
jgi:molecular chaperone HtpG